MTRRRRHAALAFAAALVLVALVTALADQAFLHTDDGCTVEVHCLACRTASIIATVGLWTAPHGVVLAAAGAIAAETPSQPRSVPFAPEDSRGPPTRS